MKMLDNTRRHLSVLGYCVKMELMSNLEYPPYIISWLVANIFQFAVGIGTMWVITERFNNINGWNFGQIAFMYGIGIVSHALNTLFFQRVRYIDEWIVFGDFDRMLLRPMGVFFQFSVCNVNMIALTDLIPGAIILITGARAIGFEWNVWNILLLIIVIISGVTIRSGVFMITGSIAFLTKRSATLSEAVNILFDKVIMYPVSIFNTGIQAFLTFIMPLAFVSFYPASYFLGKDTQFSIPGVVPLWSFAAGAIVFMIGFMLFRLGMRTYESPGN